MDNKQQKDNSGVAFPRDNNNNPKAPWCSGPVIIDGKELEVAIWKQVSKAGKNYLSLKFGPPFKKKEPAGRNEQRGEEIPF
jgi:hypothetical protein